MKPLAVLFLFVAPVLATGPAKLTGPAEVKPGGFAEVEAVGVPNVQWVVIPEPPQVSERGLVLTFAGVPGTEYTVTAFVVDFDKKATAKLRHTVRFLPADQPARPVVRPTVGVPAPKAVPKANPPPQVSAAPPSERPRPPGPPPPARATVADDEWAAMKAAAERDAALADVRRELEAVRALIPRPQPAPEVRQPPVFRGVHAGPAYDADHVCDRCGRAEYVQSGPGPVPRTHLHACKNCGHVWFHEDK